MKKIYLSLALILGLCVSANAWNKDANEGIVVLATKHLSTEAASLVQQHLGDSYLDDVDYLYALEKKKKATHSKEIHYLHLNSALQPAAGTTAANDALKGIEQAVEVLRNRAQHSKSEVQTALRTIINLMCDIHDISRTRIEGVPHSQQDFRFACYKGDMGKRKSASPLKWSSFWHYYSGWHPGFSGALWAEDMELCLGARRAELSKGTLNDWVAQIGTTAAKLYERINAEYEMTRRERNELEELNYEMMARAGYRLAEILNGVVK